LGPPWFHSDSAVSGGIGVTGGAALQADGTAVTSYRNMPGFLQVVGAHGQYAGDGLMAR
jgi:hypothetical protein